tara:strand:+ start:19780 stop:20127 length:348 start_codon:yes stop_codon:yes gene_type:complete
MTLDLTNIPVEVMDTPTKRTVGMMGRDHLDGAMVFPFGEVSEKSFWMKNCKIPLDMVFVVDNKIKNIFKNVQPCSSNENCGHQRGIADTVIEFNGGYLDDNNIEVGQSINLPSSS